MRRVTKLALATAALALAATPAAAADFSGGNGTDLSATASFTIDGSGHLIVTLTNNSASDVNNPAQILHAIFWDVATNPALTYTSANICNTCTFVGTTINNGAGTNVGAEWAYKVNAAGLGSGIVQDYGLSSAGYGIFGPGDVLAGAPDRGGAPVPPDGGDFGLLSAGYTSAGDNGGVTNNQPYIKNQVIFDLGAYNGSLTSIGNVRFQWGTALDDFQTGGVPEPSTWAMMLLGFGGIGMAMRRRRRNPTLMQVA